MAKVKREVKAPKKSMWTSKRNKSILTWTMEIAAVLLLALLCAFLFEGSITVEENSMDPTIQAGDRVLINRLSFRFGSVKRGDLIAYRNSDSTDSVYHIKRVIGIPGDTIEIRDGLILINGETYLERLDLPNIQDPGVAASPVTLGSNEYFVLGDNRNNSEDSRFADVGNIRKSDIAGRVWFIVSPSARRGFL